VLEIAPVKSQWNAKTTAFVGDLYWWTTDQVAAASAC
jgi:hypothetical protein